MADTITGHDRPFPDYLHAALERKLKVAGLDSAFDDAMERAATLPPFPDAPGALDKLAATATASPS